MENFEISRNLAELLSQYMYIYLFYVCYRSCTTAHVPRPYRRWPQCTTVYSLIQYDSTNVN